MGSKPELLAGLALTESLSEMPLICNGFKDAVSELAHLYVEMVRLGAPMGTLDLGGGLGVDYDGTQTASESSMNYTVEQYAADLVHRVKSICDDADVPHPDLVTESGRALVAHSGVLVFEVLGSRVFPDEPDRALVQRALGEGPEEEVPQPLLDLVDAHGRLDEEDADLLEIHNDAEHALGEAMDGSWHFEEVVEGDTVRDVLRFVQFDPDQMRRTLRREIETALADKHITLEEGVGMRRFLDEGLDGYTYLE